MPNDTIIVALLSLLGTLIGSVLGVLQANKVTVYRIGELEKKVEKHNNLIDRTYKLEKEIKVAQNDIESLKKKGE